MGGSAPIPRILHRIWLGSPIPAESETFWAAWRRLHPDWTLRTWQERTIPPLRNQLCYDDAEQLTAGNVWQLRSDIVRYELLEAFGGVYVDCDLEPRKPLDDLLAGIDCFAAWETTDEWVNNAILGARPHHPFLGRVIAGLPESISRHRTARPNHATGPRYLTRMHHQFPGQLTVFAQALFYPYRWDELERRDDDFPDAYTVHHWANARRDGRKRSKKK